MVRRRRRSDESFDVVWVWLRLTAIEATAIDTGPGTPTIPAACPLIEGDSVVYFNSLAAIRTAANDQPRRPLSPSASLTKVTLTTSADTAAAGWTDTDVRAWLLTPARSS
jgi:hypothetical protein